MPLVILTGGLKESGKDTFADHLVDQHGFKKLGMSDRLARAIKIVNPWILLERNFVSGENFYPQGTWVKYRVIESELGYNKAKEFQEVRTWLQVVGTDFVRKVLGDNIWVDAVKDEIVKLTNAGENVVVTGIRYPNELALELRLGHLDIETSSVWVRRKGWDENPTSIAGEHTSENSVKAEDFQYVLDNNAGLDELYASSDELLDDIKADWA